MTPLIVVSQNEQNTSQFLEDFMKTHSLTTHDTIYIEPKNKEFSIDQIRELKKNTIYSSSRLQVFVLKQFDKASYEAQNAFLKTLEEHPPHVQFILIVKTFSHLLPTVLSRSKLIQLRNDSSFSFKEEMFVKLEEFLKEKRLLIFKDKLFLASSYEDPTELLDTILEFFRRRLSHDAYATQIIKKGLSYRFALEHSTLNAQYLIDRLLILIRSSYRAS